MLFCNRTIEAQENPDKILGARFLCNKAFTVQEKTQHSRRQQCASRGACASDLRHMKRTENKQYHHAGRGELGNNWSTRWLSRTTRESKNHLYLVCCIRKTASEPRYWRYDQGNSTKNAAPVCSKKQRNSAPNAVSHSNISQIGSKSSRSVAWRSWLSSKQPLWSVLLGRKTSTINKPVLFIDWSHRACQ